MPNGKTGRMRLALLTLPWFAPALAAQSADTSALPAVARLAKAFAGEWTSVEVVQYGKPVPAGAGRRGTVRARIAEGGTALISEGRATGKVGGELKWFGTIWWDPRIGRYQFLICFTVPGDAGCELRGTAHWVGKDFVNDYEEEVDGERTKMQDVWSDIGARSYTLTELHLVGTAMVPYVVSHVTRR